MILDIDDFFADSFPVIVSTDVTLTEGTNKQLDTQALSNYFETPMVIDEIRTQIRSPLGLTQIGNFGGSVRLKLALGRYALSRVYIPVGCLGPMFEGGTIDNEIYAAGTYSPETLSAQFTDDFHVGYFRWKLPRPLVVPPGMPLDAKISRSLDQFTAAYPSATTLSVNVAYVGRVAKKDLPSGLTIPIPYVGLFENVFTSASVAASGQLDLYNPFVRSLTVQRIIGRWQNIFVDGGDPTAYSISLDSNGTLGSQQIDFPPTRIRTFSGFDVTNAFIPGLSIWEANTHALNANIEFEQGAGIEVTIDATGGVPSTGTGSNTSLVTMIGWRNEDL